MLCEAQSCNKILREWFSVVIPLSWLCQVSNYLYIMGRVIIVTSRNEVAEGGYWITLRLSVRPTFGQILMILHTGLLLGGHWTLFEGQPD